MPAVVQELYSELPVSVSKELHAEKQPSMIPDVKPGASCAHVSQSRASPLELQRTHAEGCCEETFETLDYGGKTGWCGLVDPTARGPMAFEILDREERTKSMEPKVFREQGDQAEVFRDPCEGAKEEPCQHSTATKEKVCPSQDVLLMQSNKEPVCAEFPGDLLKKKGFCAVSTMNKGKKELCNLNLVCEADDSHQRILNHCRENPGSAQDSSITAGSEESIKPAEENSKILYLASYSSGPKSLEKCVFESSALVKESAEKIKEVDQSKNFSCGEESKEQNQRPSSERGGLLFSVTEQEQNGSGEKQTVESSNHSNDCTQASSCAEICSSMPNSFTEATEIMCKKSDLKITLNFQGNLVNSEEHRKTVTDVNHPERHSEESGFPLLVHVEEPEQNPVNSSALSEKIYSKDSKSVVSAQRNLGDSLPTKAACSEFLSGRKSPQSLIPADPVSSEHKDISKPKESPAKLPPCPEFVCRPASEKHVQDLRDNVAHLDEPIIASEICELSCNSELVEHKLEHECVLNQQVSLNSQEHVILPTDSLINLNREMPSATCRDAQQSCHSLKNGANLTTNTQTIPAETKLEVTSAQGDRTCGASSGIHTLNLTTSPEGQKEMTDSGIKDLHSTFLSSVKETAGFSFVTECQNVQSQDISSCQCITRSASEENMCSACAAFGPRKDTLKASNCKVNCGNARQSSRHCFQRSEDLVENSSFLESEPAGRKTQSSLLRGKVTSEMATGVAGSRVLLNTTTPTTGHVEPSGRKPSRHRCTAVYSHSTSPCDIQELSQSTNIPSPDTLADQSLNVISSHLKAMYQAAQSHDQKVGEVSDCQRNQNSPDKCRSEGKTAQEGLSGDPRETVPEVSHKEKDLLVSSGSENPVLCGSLEKSDSKGAFENIPGSEALVYSVLDVVCPDCTSEPAEAVLGASSPASHSTSRDRLAYHESLRSIAPLRGELNVVFIGTTDQDSGLSSAAASTVDCPEILKSREETICRFLKDYEMEECPDSATDREVECITNQEPNVRALDKGGVSLNYIHCENQGEGKSVTEGLRIEANSEFGEKETFGLSSKDSRSRCRGSVEIAQSRVSSQEQSPASVLGEKPKLKHLFKPKDGDILHENIKNCAVQSDVKEAIPTNIGNAGEGGGTYVSVDTSVCKACHSHENSIDKCLPLIMITAIKQNKEETEEHQKGPLGHLPVGEGSEETITRDSHVNFPKSYQTHLKCQSVQDVAKSPQSQRVESAVPKDENPYQKGTRALLEQHTSVNMFSDEMQSKKPVIGQGEFLIMEEVALRKPTKKKTARPLQRLEDPEKESLCHLLKKDTLCTGPRLPGTSWKEQDPSAAGGGQIHGAFVTLSQQQRLLPIKKQPHRTCKRTSCPELVTVQRKITKVRNSDCGKSSSNPIPTKTHRLLSPCAVPAAPLEPETVPSTSLCSHIPKPKATLCHPLSPSCRKPTKESALLNKLSLLASKLVLATKPQKLRYQRYSSSLVPLAKSCKRLRYKKLLDGFSYNAMQLDPCLAATGWDRRSNRCYRIWTKRRSFTNHMPTMQRLFLTQFTRGLKGLRSPASLADKVFCSLPYSVGRVLSIWSQHGPSFTFQLPALHSTQSKQQGSLSILSSHNTIPNVPLPGMGAVHSTNSSHLRLEPVFPALVPKACLVTEPAVSKLLLSASEFQVPEFDELGDVSAACPRPQSSPAEEKEAEPEKRPKKVSQIRIRKTIPKPDPNLTPMGLPRPKRLKKKEFSLEEIYTNKNYKSPPANRCLETIFEEPKERNGTLVSVSQQKRKRVLEFQDFTLPRKRRARGKVKLVGSFTRAQKAALQTRELDALLIQKLLELETFFAKEEELEQSASC
ncbi:hypothetical protein ACRRTK_014619 [Alexandromys fortis]